MLCAIGMDGIEIDSRQLCEQVVHLDSSRRFSTSDRMPLHADNAAGRTDAAHRLDCTGALAPGSSSLIAQSCAKGPLHTSAHGPPRTKQRTSALPPQCLLLHMPAVANCGLERHSASPASTT